MKTVNIKSALNVINLFAVCYRGDYPGLDLGLGLIRREDWVGTRLENGTKNLNGFPSKRLSSQLFK